MSDSKTFMVEGAQLIFKNFSGREGQYNREGDRNFAVILDPTTAKKMLSDGWNVRELDPREEGEAPIPYISVSVNFKNKPPNVVMITSSARTQLNDDTVSVLDYAEIANCDLIARAYVWQVGDKTGVKAYLKSMFVTIEEDELERKYATQEDESGY